jgi:hypothetical protein
MTKNDVILGKHQFFDLSDRDWFRTGELGQFLDFADPEGQCEMFAVFTHGSVSKPCTPGEHQNSW